jgi:hypothetical protein
MQDGLGPDFRPSGQNSIFGVTSSLPVNSGHPPTIPGDFRSELEMHGELLQQMPITGLFYLGTLAVDTLRNWICFTLNALYFWLISESESGKLCLSLARFACML